MGKKNILTIIVLVLVSCSIMALVDGVWQPPYFIKSALKVMLFLLCPIAYGFISGEFSARSLFHFEKKALLKSVFLGIAVYAAIITAFLVFRNFFDFSKITTTLETTIGVTAGNFIWVSIYISFVNSLLEEFFFRGFAFLTLKDFVRRKTAYLFSAAMFSLYHVAMMFSWFNIFLYILIVVGLFVSGLFFDWLNERSRNIYSSWMVHMFANFAINTVGFILFGLIG